mgnify:CR=1 FL=1
MGNDLQKKYGLPTAIALVVGIVIGSGIFFKAEKIRDRRQRPRAASSFARRPSCRTAGMYSPT